MLPETSNGSPVSLPAQVLNSLRERGFQPDGWSYRKEGLTVTALGRWYVLSEEADGPGNLALSGGQSQPGLWKYVHDGSSPRRRFEIPSWVVSVQPDDDRLDQSGPAPFERLLAWALETRLGRVPPGWQPPDKEMVRSWIAQGGLTVQAKGYVRQAELILQPDRWAVRTPILPPLGEVLSEPRRHALAELVAEAQRRWAMIRLVAPTDSKTAALIAEVDLSGAPHSELLFSAGLDVLRHVVAWLVETADVLADPEVVIACLAAGAVNNSSNLERKTP